MHIQHFVGNSGKSVDWKDEIEKQLQQWITGVMENNKPLDEKVVFVCKLLQMEQIQKNSEILDTVVNKMFVPLVTLAVSDSSTQNLELICK